MVACNAVTTGSTVGSTTEIGNLDVRRSGELATVIPSGLARVIRGRCPFGPTVSSLGAGFGIVRGRIRRSSPRGRKRGVVIGGPFRGNVRRIGIGVGLGGYCHLIRSFGGRLSRKARRIGGILRCTLGLRKDIHRIKIRTYTAVVKQNGLARCVPVYLSGSGRAKRSV